ncbi:replication protein A subunit RPA32 [Trametes maxima]|nr:replication protein A subunit RPA32 [Trametes maxima]
MSGFGENPFYGNGGYLSQNSPFGSGGSPGGGQRKYASHTMRPVTLKQLTEATQAHSDAEWMIRDVEVGQVTTVAHVISVQPQTTNNIYFLNDGTANMEARQWVNANDDEGNNTEEIKEGTYVRVLGTLKVFGNKRYITATHIKPDRSVDELLFHILEAATVALILERGSPRRPSEGASGLTSGANGNAGAHSAYTAQSTTTAASTTQFSHLPPLQRQIVTFILSQPRSEEGVHVAAIARHIAANNGGAQKEANSISEALDGLMDQGHVYTTIDESHFSVSE